MGCASLAPCQPTSHLKSTKTTPVVQIHALGVRSFKMWKSGEAESEARYHRCWWLRKCSVLAVSLSSVLSVSEFLSVSSAVTRKIADALVLCFNTCQAFECT